ncbi:DNA repair protein RecO [Candidatus Woesebacteria bacterium RBG_16_36_11]|uniref:DNA repair protein RecO n=3 Tax=Candidatus Woeseibacteriota TaxID=1752722 RepID=A0A1F7X9J6_9BACT|nr:MAG: DNA repair protein RecO [Candidatus Woesebacteria bacterium RBG_13_36_22]OGM11700.1 MAG: DNA repair protein RecO [Candidatus Woesebacteria bacterium RBG_16_36_11]OGM16444.1 MAG: DNA repair protein RecO [Candidatus Woesebacteria bacterium RBG_19FT_COMBO_37_29]
MESRSYKTKGIILARKDYSESDRILSVYTKDFGRVSLLAKGVRMPKSRKRGHIEVFSLVDFQAVRGKGIDIMTEVEIIDNFAKIRKDLKKVALAYYFMEVIGKITSENEHNTKIFESVLHNLEALKYNSSLKEQRLNFIHRILVDLGFWPKGKVLEDADAKLSEILERNLNSIRVGKRILS